MGYDQITFNKIGTLDAEARIRQSAYDVAKAVRDALASRVTSFETELAAAKADLDTAQRNLSLALKTEKSVRGAMKAALISARQEIIIYAYVKKVFQLAHSTANQAILAGYTISALLTEVVAAEAKNSYITPRLLTATQAADASAATAVTAATAALQNAMAALSAVERSVGATCLVMASIMNLQRLTSGYTPFRDTDEDGIPDALLVVPQPDLRSIDISSILGESQDRARLEVSVDGVLTNWIHTFMGLQPMRDAREDPRDGPVERLLAMLFPEEKPKKEGLTQILKDISDQTLDAEKRIDDATTQAKVQLSSAEQYLARRQAERDAVQRALAAAKQAA
jgi:hypothetical protein